MVMLGLEVIKNERERGRIYLYKLTLSSLLSLSLSEIYMVKKNKTSIRHSSGSQRETGEGDLPIDSHGGVRFYYCYYYYYHPSSQGA